MGTRFAPHPERTPSFKLWLRYAKPSRGRLWSTRGPPGSCVSRVEPAAGGDHRRGGRVLAGDAVEVVCDGDVVGKGISTYSSSELGQIKGLRSDPVLERMPNASEEAVHRDHFVLT